MIAPGEWYPSFCSVLRAAQSGDSDAIASLYRSAAPAVLGYLRGHGAAEPEDLTSEVFIGVMRGLPAFRGREADFRSWLFTIAHRRLLDERRRSTRRREQLVEPEMLGALLPPVEGPEDQVVERLAANPALKALAVLTEDQRSVVLLRLLADLPVARVAQILGKQEGAIKTLHRRALAALARTVEREAVC